MSLQRGENIRGWGGVTRNLGANSDERAAWNFTLVCLMLTFIVAGLVALFLSKSDIPIVAKAVLTLGVVLFTLVLVSATYSGMVRRANEKDHKGDLDAGRGNAVQENHEDLAMEAPTMNSAPMAAPSAGTGSAAMPASAATTAESGPTLAPEPVQANAPAAPEPTPMEPIAEPAPVQLVSEAAPEPQPEQESDPAAMAAPISEPASETGSDASVEEPAADPGVRPVGLDGARDGVPDDLTLIKGVGPKLADLCHSLGFYHYDQIAAWSADEVAWVDQNLEGFKGRVTRDEWVSQAKILAEGGQTEFSQRQQDS